MKANLSGKLFPFLALLFFGCKKEEISNNSSLINKGLIGTWSVDSIKNVTFKGGKPTDSVIVEKTNIYIKFDKSTLNVISDNHISSDVKYSLSHVSDNEFVVTINDEDFLYSQQSDDRMIVRNTSVNGENQEVIQMAYKKIK